MHIRGVNNPVRDLPYEEEAIETVMWNPLHFAVYHQHLHIVKYLISDLRINVSITAPKAHGESESDPTNSVNFPEDKFMLLLMAFAKRDRPMLEFLLDELWYFWSITFKDHFFNSISQHDEHINSLQDPWLEVIPIVLRSRTLHTYFLNLSFKKRKQWVSKFIMDVTTGNNVDRQSRLYHERVQMFKTELTLQPYSGVYLFYLMLEEFSDEYEIAEQAFANTTQFDFSVHISCMEES